MLKLLRQRSSISLGFTRCCAWFIAVSGFAGAATAATATDWMPQQEAYSIEYLLRNISPAGAARGAIVASPSRNNPDYFYHWIRDAALTSDIVVELYARGGATQAQYDQLLSDYIDFSRQLQNTPNPSGGLGEPKFNADGTAFTGPWGRPQNDGPALRATAMIRLARLWLQQGQEDRVRQKLYDGKLPTNTLIKADLEFVAHHWQDTGFDLWEEVSGHHFFTRMVQRQALIEGAQLAVQLGDNGAASYYQQQAAAVQTEIGKFWDAGRGILTETLDWNGGVNYKNSGIDSAVILGVIHGQTGDGFLSPSNDQVLATVLKQEQAFASVFPINAKGLPAIAIGRYPEDRYSGADGNNEGNPWLLATMAFGELYHRAAQEFAAAGKITIDSTDLAFFQALLGSSAPAQPVTYTNGDAQFAAILGALHARGDAYMERGHYHGQADGHYSEQINRYNGYMQSAPDLTWSYASFLTAYWSRPVSK